MRLKHLIAGCFLFIFITLLLEKPLITSLAENTGNNELSSITAKNYIVMDATTGQVLYEKASDEKVAVSYMVKLMTLLLTAQAIDDGKLSTQDILTTSSHANSMGDPQIWLNINEQISADELIKSITIGNANDACVVLAEAISKTEDDFVKLMNAKANELHMDNTVFLNSTGIEAEGQFSTSYDLALLSKELLNYENLIPYMTTWMTDVRQGQTNLVNLNKLVRNYKGVTGIKAASSAQAGNCIIVSAKRNDMHLICVLLGCATSDSRYTDAKSILDISFSSYQYYNPELAEDELCPIRVKSGQKQYVEITTADNLGVVIPSGTAKGVEVKITLPEEVEAPVEKGQIIGVVEFFKDEKLIFKSNIIANENIKRTDIFFCFQRILQYLLKF